MWKAQLNPARTSRSQLRTGISELPQPKAEIWLTLSLMDEALLPGGIYSPAVLAYSCHGQKKFEQPKPSSQGVHAPAGGSELLNLGRWSYDFLSDPKHIKIRADCVSVSSAMLLVRNVCLSTDVSV